MQRAEWMFLSNHGRVLIYIAKHLRSTTREIAAEAGITKRAVQKIIAALETAGYVARYKEGRCNIYTINSDMPMRHRLEREHAVRNLLVALGCDLEEGRAAQ